jgi:hypothetical protein
LITPERGDDFGAALNVAGVDGPAGFGAGRREGENLRGLHGADSVYCVESITETPIRVMDDAELAYRVNGTGGPCGPSAPPIIGRLRARARRRAGMKKAPASAKGA